MKHPCALCGNEIKHYQQSIHEFEIDATRSAAVCSACTQKFLKWQQKTYASLFPTRTAKKLVTKDRDKG